jgi:hypothetical protein
MTEGICSMQQDSLSVMYSILYFESQEITTHLIRHAFHILLGAVHTEKN